MRAEDPAPPLFRTRLPPPRRAGVQRCGRGLGAAVAAGLVFATTCWFSATVGFAVALAFDLQ